MKRMNRHDFPEWSPSAPANGHRPAQSRYTERARGGRSLYRRRVQRVINYISHHLDEDLRPDVLADVAGLSRFHFHRVFKGVTGETPVDCIRRLRLEWAATLLLTHRHLPIVEVAIEAGFRTQAHFAREFHKHFGMSASQWRQGRFWHYNGQYWDWRAPAAVLDKYEAGTARLRYPDKALADAANGHKPRCLERIEVGALPGFRIVYTQVTGPDEPRLRREQWRMVARRLGDKALQGRDPMWVSVFRDNPHVTAPERCRYDLGMVIDRQFELASDLELQEIPGGDYVTIHFRGRANEERLVGEYLWQYWLPRNELQQDVLRPVFIRVQGDVDALAFTRDSECAGELCVPVMPAGRPLVRARRTPV